MIDQQLTYQESGEINLIKQIISYILCALITLVMGYVYSSIIIFIPVVYINYLITTGVGIGLGFVCRLTIRLGENRSKKSQIIQAVIVGVMFNYFQWTAYVLHIYNGGIPSIDIYLKNILWITDPTPFILAVDNIHTIGTWSIFGIPFNGFFLTVVWIMELAITIAIPVIAVVRTKIYPYSELLQKWYPKYTLYKDFESISSQNILVEELSNNPLKTIEDLGKGTSNRYSKIHIFYLKDETSQYMTFEKIHIEGNGRGQLNRDIVINNFRISTNEADLILGKFENKKEKIDLI